jgi:WD40 repeat protein
MKLHSVPGTNQLAASFGEHWILLDSKTGELIQSSPAQVVDKKSQNDVAIRCLVVSKDQKAIIARNDKSLQLWDLSTGSMLCSTSSIKRVNTMKFTGDGSKIILGIHYTNKKAIRLEISTLSQSPILKREITSFWRVISHLSSICVSRLTSHR